MLLDASPHTMSTLPSPLKSPVATTLYPAVVYWLKYPSTFVPPISHQPSLAGDGLYTSKSDLPSPLTSLCTAGNVGGIATLVSSNCAINAAVLFMLCALSAEFDALSATPHGVFWQVETLGLENRLSGVSVAVPYAMIVEKPFVPLPR